MLAILISSSIIITMSKIQNQSTKGDAPIEELPAACADEATAVEFMEKHRWGDYPGCPRCGDMDVYQMKSRSGEREKHFRWRCRGCKKQFSVRTGTVFEDSPAPLVLRVLARLNQQEGRLGPRDSPSNRSFLQVQPFPAAPHPVRDGPNGRKSIDRHRRGR